MNREFDDYGSHGGQWKEKDYLLNVKWDSIAETEQTPEPKGETLDLHVEARNDASVIVTRAEWLRDTLDRIYSENFEEHILIDIGNAIQSEERKRILTMAFYHLYNKYNISIRTINRGFKTFKLRIIITMKQKDSKSNTKTLDWWIEKMARRPSMFQED